MELIKEIREHKFEVINKQPYVNCKVFEDKSGTVELAKLPRLHPHKRHIIICYYHFWEHVRKDLIKIFAMDTKDQITDAHTKALSKNDFLCYRKHMCGQIGVMSFTRIIVRDRWIVNTYCEFMYEQLLF
jgi:hypothetical protein